MKFNTKLLLLTIASISLIAETSQIGMKSRTRVLKNIKYLSKFTNQFTNSTGGNSTGAASGAQDGGNSTSGNSSKPDPAKNGTNPVALIDPKVVLDADPFEVRKCDQILQFEGKTITDMMDYKQREARYFTMSMYLVNEFKSKDQKTLEKSIILSSLRKVPDILRGSVNCIDFLGATRRITICFDTPEVAQKVINAQRQFESCRMGNDLQSLPPTPEAVFRKMFEQSCAGLKIDFSKTNYTGKNATRVLDAAIERVMQILAANSSQYLVQPNSTNLTAGVPGAPAAGLQK